ncbi:MAG: sensor histidine kinase, partial [Nitrospirae bacterium]
GLDALLDFSRRRPAAPEPVALAPFLEETLELLRPRARQEGKGIDLRVPEGLTATVLPTQLQQAVVNLVANGLDATPPGGGVRVGAEGRGDRVCLWVEDDGPGIPEGEVEAAFEPFVTTKAPGAGAGMGLPIAANFVHACGGTLRYERAAGGGARFVVDLPR